MPLAALLGRIEELLRWRARYCPEKHYMRGPGPKCRERNADRGTRGSAPLQAD